MLLNKILQFFSDKSFRFFVLFFLFGCKGDRYRRRQVDFLGFKIKIVDSLSFLWQVKEIFCDKEYMFDCPGDEPVIYDCGANIGCSVLFFKMVYPKARVVSFEADPCVFDILKENISVNNLEGIEVHNVCLMDHDGSVDFYPDQSDGGSVFGAGRSVTVSSKRLSGFISSEDSVDFLKIDIEGAEFNVLMDIEPLLYKIKNIYIEYHSVVGGEQILGDILNVLKNNGFRYYVNHVHKIKNVYIAKERAGAFDMQLNIYAYQ